MAERIFDTLTTPPEFKPNAALKERWETAVENIKHHGALALAKIGVTAGLTWPIMSNFSWQMEKLGFQVKPSPLSGFLRSMADLGRVSNTALPAAAATLALDKQGPGLAQGVLEVLDTQASTRQLGKIEEAQAAQGITPETASVLQSLSRLKQDFARDGGRALSRFIHELTENKKEENPQPTEMMQKMGFTQEQAGVLQGQWNGAVEAIARHGSAAAAKIFGSVFIARELSGPISNLLFSVNYLIMGPAEHRYDNPLGHFFMRFSRLLSRSDWNWKQGGWTIPLIFTVAAARTHGPSLISGLLQAVDMQSTRSLGAKIEMAKGKRETRDYQKVNETVRILKGTAAAENSAEIGLETPETVIMAPYQRLGFDTEEAYELSERWKEAVAKIAKHGSEAVEKISLALMVGQVAGDWTVLVGVAWAGWKNRDLLTGVFEAIDVQRTKGNRAGKQMAAVPRETAETVEMLTKHVEEIERLIVAVPAKQALEQVMHRLLGPGN